MKKKVSVRINGRNVSAEVEPRTLLSDFVRENAGMTGTHVGCDTTSCGACTLMLDGRAVKSCTVLAVQADGSAVTTIEGLAKADGTLHPLQEGFNEEHALQCGFCTPGMVMTAYQLLERNKRPSETEIRHALEGNFCRCTGYDKIVKAVQYAANKL